MASVTLESMPREIMFGVTDVILEVMQNCRTILTTRKGTVPLDREFGIAADFLDSPMPTVRAEAEQDIFMAIRRYEPRAVLKEITWDADILSGKVMPRIKIEVVP